MYWVLHKGPCVPEDLFFLHLFKNVLHIYHPSQVWIIQSGSHRGSMWQELFPSHVHAGFHFWMRYINCKNINRSVGNNINIYGCLSQLRLTNKWWGGLTTDIYFLTVSGAGSPKLGCWHGGVLVRTLFLAYFLPWPHVASPQCMYVVREKEGGVCLSSYKASSTIRLGLHSCDPS